MSSSPQNAKAIRGQVRAILADEARPLEERLKEVNALIPAGIGKLPFSEYHSLTRTHQRKIRKALQVLAAMNEFSAELIAKAEQRKREAKELIAKFAIKAERQVRQRMPPDP